MADVVIIGAGPGGSCLAAYLAKAGVDVLVVDKAPFPRFHIGESLTGIAGQILEELGLTSKLDRLQFPRKGGVKVIGQKAQSEFFVPVLIPTYQVRRADFDELLLRRARKAGAHFQIGEVTDVLREGDRVVGVRLRGEGGTREIRAPWVVDASGQSVVLSKLGVAGRRRLNPLFDKQVALFTHIEGARRDPGEMGNNTFIFYDKLHHWAWFIPVSPTVTSVGVVMPDEVFRPLGGKQEALAWGLENINPDLCSRTAEKPWIEPVRAAVNYSYEIEPFVGPGWLCVGDAHGFIDPIFSFGVSIALQEAREASRRLQAILAGADAAPELEAYARYCRRGFSVAADVIDYFWQYPVFFGYMMRGSLRRDVIRLLGSDIHAEEELPAIATMRKALRRSASSRTPAQVA